MGSLKLTLAYDGTAYHGFQEQRGSGLATIQEVLEQCLGKLAGHRVQVVGAGRTDARVHARGQVVSFPAAGWPVPVNRITPALNGLLPDDIVVVKAEEVAPEFHARFDAVAKTYHYYIFTGRLPCPFQRLYAYYLSRPLDAELIRQAAEYLVGTFDFKAFQAAGATTKTSVRTIYAAAVEQQGDMLSFSFRGDGFLYNQVRIMVGTLIQVGWRKIPVTAIPEIIATGNRTLAGPTVPPRGLFLEQVEYPLAVLSRVP